MHNFIFGIYPYIALTVLAIGSIARYERDPFTWKTSSSQLLRRKQLILGSVLFHLGVLVIFVGHQNVECRGRDINHALDPLRIWLC